jgi:hypothetical protein
MNTYLIKSKVELIKQARDDFKQCYGIDYTPFTRKMFFYFFIYGDKKYVHKQSLEFVYANANTYTTDVFPDKCALEKQLVPLDILPILSAYQGRLLPPLVEETDKFLVYQYTDGIPVDNISKDEYYFIKEQDSLMEVTPFYNSMAYNLARSQDRITLIDFKHFETRSALPFFVYLYNEFHGINTLYVDQSPPLQEILQHLATDYPASASTIVKF